MKWTFILALAPALLGAQERARVLVGLASGKAAVVDFSPCVGAETSDCGAWVDHLVDSTSPPVITAARSADGRDSVWIAGGVLHIRPLRRGAKITTIRDKRGQATAIAVHPWGRSAFLVLQSKLDTKGFVLMIDLDSRSSIASTSLGDRPAGIAVIR